jgi:hypothetical protein
VHVQQATLSMLVGVRSFQSIRPAFSSPVTAVSL